MTRKWFSIIVLVAAATFLLNVSSCGFNQHLVSINIPESGGTFFGVGPGIFFDFTAIGTYIHPPQTKDITDLVTWKSDNPQVVQVSNTGVVSPNVTCGLANISASFYDSPNDVISNSVPVTVNGPASLGCTPAGSQPILTVSFSGNGTGTVTGTGISCTSPSSCSDQFAVGTTITLTAAPTGGSTFASWTNCNSTGGANNSVCTITLENNATVTAAFNP
jgi:Divergent InlB B-repeat domain